MEKCSHWESREIISTYWVNRSNAKSVNLFVYSVYD